MAAGGLPPLEIEHVGSAAVPGLPANRVRTLAALALRLGGRL